MKTTLLEIQKDYHYSGDFGLLISHDNGAHWRQAIGQLDIEDLKLLRKLIRKAIKDGVGKRNNM